MSGHILVLGATGRVGSLVVSELAAAGAPVSGLVRDAAKAQRLWPDGVEARVGDLSDVASVTAAVQRAAAVLVASPVHPEMAQWQRAAVRAAVDAGVRRIVKLSGSSWTLRPGELTTVGKAHAGVEAELWSAAEGGVIEAVCIRPNAFLQGMLGRVAAEVQRDGGFSLAIGDARVAFADVRDIAAACARALTLDAPPPAYVEVTGPMAVSGLELAGSMRDLLQKPVAYRPISVDEAVARAGAAGASAYTQAHQREVLLRLQAGAGAPVSPDFTTFTGRRARGPGEFLADTLICPDKN